MNYKNIALIQKNNTIDEYTQAIFRDNLHEMALKLVLLIFYITYLSVHKLANILTFWFIETSEVEDSVEIFIKKISLYLLSCLSSAATLTN